MDRKSLKPESINRKCFISVLDWGLGHATRCVPIIRELLQQNVNVVIGASGLALEFLKDEFPDLTFYKLPSYGITYPEKGRMIFSIVWQLPKIKRIIRQENKLLSKIVQKEKIDFIISDNRYGCHSTRIRSIFVGHQLNLQMPSGLSWLSSMLNKLHLRMIKKFDQVWIPDEDGGFHFSGILSKCSLPNAKRIGILSRFHDRTELTSESYEIVALISGPEPQRAIFENLLREQLHKSKRKSLMVKGKPGRIEKRLEGMLTEYNHLRSNELESVLVSATVVVARSGYSTIMDLATLGKQAIFIPTPGQTEQEYLAQYLMDNKMAYTQSQAQFNLEQALTQLTNFGSLPKTTSNSGLPQAFQEIL